MQNYFPIKKNSLIYSVKLESVLYIESDLRKIKVVTGPGPKNVHVSNEQLCSVRPDLPSHFIQCHKSFVVNLKQVERLEDRCFFFRDGIVVAISQSRYSHAKEDYKSFLRYG